MIRENAVDVYFDRQPKATFPEQLKVYTPHKIYFTANKDLSLFASIKGIYLDCGEFRDDKLLQASFDDFNNFTTYNQIKGHKFAVLLCQNSDFLTEEFSLSVKVDCCVITAGEREGIRRALVKIQDLIVSEGGYLKIGYTHYKMALERRISRCFFSPINRPPHNREELGDDIDYYPDGYLTKLMHDGVNAIWICSDFDSLIKSKYITEFGKGSEKRIAKLNRVIDKCARFGVGVFLFMIEPISLHNPTLLKKYPRIYEKYPQVDGNKSSGPTAFCTFTKWGEDYLADAVTTLFSLCPSLAGMMSITHGERVTSCANAWADSEGVWHNNCPHCKDKSQSEIVTHTVDIIVNSMKKVNPNAEFISWTYGHRDCPYEVVEEYTQKISDKAIMMQNFEDGGRAEQLGKTRYAFDYYLCYPGPSQLFNFTASNSKKYNKKLYAKMQICCSHELATMPYIPAPGIIFDKIVGAKKLDVKGVMESWFFGNYPCLMSKSVELLAYENDFASKRDFLLALSSIYYKKEDCPLVADAWECFESAYRNYPINVMFNYYGPMHDGVVWDLALLPRNFSLSRSWLLVDSPDGDRIGECLFSGHTLDEVISLCTTLLSYWDKGCEILSSLDEWKDEDNEQMAIIKGLRILFKSGLNILNFYSLRDKLGYQNGVDKQILDSMRDIVYDEMKNSADMIPLCEKHNCLGYHSEAEGFKFFPEKLSNRINLLKNLLDNEFSLVYDRINKGLPPLEYYLGNEQGVKSCVCGRNGLDSATWNYLDDNASMFRVALDGDKIRLELKSDKETDFFVCNEFHLMFPQSTYIFKRNGEVSLHRDAKSHQSVLDDKREKYLNAWSIECLSSKGNTHIIASASLADAQFVRLPYKMMIRSFMGANWCVDPLIMRVLGKCTTSPADFGWVK